MSNLQPPIVFEKTHKRRGHVLMQCASSSDTNVRLFLPREMNPLENLIKPGWQLSIAAHKPADPAKEDEIEAEDEGDYELILEDVEEDEEPEEEPSEQDAE
ncbi:hypothetical protein LJC33_04630 [Eubacteriales bacterium OttesenSCG-928-N13]|nr:hypothetical protein [Eubacteriales bacterium OttesenSCG-928-N13]